MGGFEDFMQKFSNSVLNFGKKKPSRLERLKEKYLPASRKSSWNSGNHRKNRHGERCYTRNADGNALSYNPREEYLSRAFPGAGGKSGGESSSPSNLCGRSSFNVPDSPLGREGQRFCRQPASGLSSFKKF